MKKRVQWRRLKGFRAVGTPNGSPLLAQNTRLLSCRKERARSFLTHLADAQLLQRLPQVELDLVKVAVVQAWPGGINKERGQQQVPIPTPPQPQP